GQVLLRRDGVHRRRPPAGERLRPVPRPARADRLPPRLLPPGYSPTCSRRISPDYSPPPPRGYRRGASRPFVTEPRPERAPATHHPLTPIWGSHSNGLSSGSAGGIGNRIREGITHALTHPAIPTQVRPAR